MALVNKFFVAHAYTADTPDLRRAIQEASAPTGLQPVFADEKVIDGHILDKKILPMIVDSAFCLFEISNRNRPNVFLEYGFAKAVGRPCYLVLKDGVKPPSDLDGYDRVQYQNYVDLRQRLQRLLEPLAHAIFSEEVAAMTVLPEEPAGVLRVRNDKTGAVFHFVLAADGGFVLHPRFEVKGTVSDLEAARALLRFQTAMDRQNGTAKRSSSLKPPPAPFSRRRKPTPVVDHRIGAGAERGR